METLPLDAYLAKTVLRSVSTASEVRYSRFTKALVSGGRSSWPPFAQTVGSEAGREHFLVTRDTDPITDSRTCAVHGSEKLWLSSKSPLSSLFWHMYVYAVRADVFGISGRQKASAEGKGTLSDEHKSYSVFDQEDRPASLKDVLDVAEKKQQICIERRLKFKKNEKQIVIRDLLDRVIGWVNRFKEVGGGDADLGRWGNDRAQKEQLMQAMVKLYTAVLTFISRAIQRLRMNTHETADLNTDIYFLKMAEDKFDVDEIASKIEMYHSVEQRDSRAGRQLQHLARPLRAKINIRDHVHCSADGDSRE
ncbi:hypothetical protein F5882DRAFT_376487 [Hyaloscypha sp. PMI_1271]|nr:hypothetical protein F5882DRAFT_376487 [Hyaloscypha sp. PMI_1271]